MTPRLDAFGIVASNMARSVAFYRRLGLDFSDDAENEQHVEAQLGGGVRFMIDTEEVVRAFDSSWQRPSSGHLHAGAFQCESPDEVDHVFRELVEAGGSAYKEPWDAFWGQRYAQLEDPDGNLVDLYAALPDADAAGSGSGA